MKSKMKVAFLLSIITERGGIGRVTSLLTDELNATGLFEIHIVSYAKKQENSYDWNSALPYHHLLENRVPMKKGIVKASMKLRKIIDDHKIDIFISCGAIVGPLGVLGTIFKRTRLVYWSHSSFKGSSNKQFRLFNEHFAALFSASVVSLTKVDKENYERGTWARKVYQIYNPIDVRLEKSRAVYNTASNKIISVGRLAYQKNFETLIDVAALLVKEDHHFVWDIYGSGEEEQKLQEKIRHLGLEKYVVLKGQANNLYDLYPNYSIMVMTSRYEGFPMSLIEGLASRLPLVSFDIPTGPNEIIKENFNGFLIRPFEELVMAKKIGELLTDVNLRSTFSNNNMTLVHEFNMENIVQKWIHLFSKLSTANY